METRLQSNEVRIPKPEFDLKGSHSAAGPDLNSSTGSGSSSNCNHYFKSSFARSLSSFGSSSSPQSKSLDYAINYPHHRFNSIDEDGDMSHGGGCDSSHSPLSMPPIYYSTDMFEDEEANHKAVTEQSTESLVSSSSTATVRNVWTTNAQTTTSGKNTVTPPVKCNTHRLSQFKPIHHLNTGCDSTEIEVLRLRKECQNLIEENRRLLNLSGIVGGNNGHHHASNVEAVILQNQVDTLQWQLKQVESSRQMYRAVMEEVVRFLERCHHSLDNMVVEEPITRSKSSHHVHHDADSSQMSNGSDNDQSIIASPSPPPGAPASSKPGIFTSRLRCSTIDAPKLFNRNLSNAAINSSIQTAGSYTNFRDFTWRRNRKPFNRTMSAVEVDSEKLSQEAFRLLRTANNLLNTQEPSLMLPKNIFDSTYSSPTPSPHLMPQSLNSSFCRKSNGRQSSTSMRSCCDTNSTSSNSSGTSSVSSSAQKAPLASALDMDTVHELVGGGKPRSIVERKCKGGGPGSDPVNSREVHPNGMLLQSEGESGFSSISSFQEIGLPLASSQHNHLGSPKRPSGSSNASSSGDSNAECDLTIQAVQKEQPPILPQRMPTIMAYSHRRWDSAPALPPKKSSSLHAFNSSANAGEETLQVLWV